MDKKRMLEQLIEYYENGNKSQFAKRLGVTPQGVSTWLNRNTFDAELIFAKCEGLSADWLLTGEGSMLKNKINDIPVAYHTENPSEGIPLIPISAMAGTFTTDEQILECDCDRYVVPAFKGADYLIGVKGVSMHPRFSPGDIVACKRLPMTDLFFQWNKVYVLDTDQGSLIKRLKPGSDKEHVLVVSDNQEYDPFELAINKIYHVALVIGVIRLE